MTTAATFQGTKLNQTLIPVQRGQTNPAAPVASQASADDITARLEAAEAAIIALQAIVADHEARITDLEP